MSFQKFPGSINTFDMKDLTLDVKLDVTRTKDNFVVDMTGKKSYTIGMFREGVGFGITNIDIEIKASLQPLITIKFLDLYGATAFDLNRKDKDTDYSALFDWPPPKFKLTVKGYLGHPISWILSWRKASTRYLPDNGGYEITVEFIPNQWGFFADIPFLYLLAKKRLDKEHTKEQKDNEITCVLDYIKVGTKVEQTFQEVSTKYEGLKKQLSEFKTDALEFTKKYKGELIKGNGITGFVDFTVTSELDNNEIIALINTRKNDNDKKSILVPNEINKILISSLVINNSLKTITPTKYSFPSENNKKTFNDELNKAKEILNNNIKTIESAVSSETFTSTQGKIGQITISKCFSRLAADTAFILGSILDAGNNGYIQNKDIRDTKDREGKLIGLHFPLEFVGGKEVPAEEVGIDKKGCEMDFVNEFIKALVEGYIEKTAFDAENNNSNNISSIPQPSNPPFISINMLEEVLGTENPYKSDFKNIAENILVRSAIISFITRSDEIEKPGLNISITTKTVYERYQELANNDIENITSSILTALNSDEQGKVTQKQELIKFCNFFIEFFDEFGDKLTNISVIENDKNVVKDIPIPTIDEAGTIPDIKKIKNLRVFSKKSGIDTTIGKYLEQFSSVFDFNTFTATELKTNNIIFKLPVTVNKSQEILILFNGEIEKIHEGIKVIKSTDLIDSDNVKEFNDAIDETRIFYYNDGKFNMVTKNDKITTKTAEKSFFYIPYAESDSYLKNLTFGLFETRFVNPDKSTMFNIFARNQRKILRYMCNTLLTKFQIQIDENIKKTNEILGNLEDKDKKNALYIQMHHIYHQWHSVDEDIFKNGTEKEEGKKITETTNTNNNKTAELLESLYLDKDREKVDSPNSTFGFKYSWPHQECYSTKNNIVNVGNSIVYTKEAFDVKSQNMSVLNVFQNICLKNNFLFIPVTINGIASSIDGIFKAHSNIESSDGISNFFHVMFSPTPESRNYYGDRQPLEFGKNAENNKNNLDAFEISYGSPDNKIIKNVDINTDSNRPTAESIIAINDLTEKNNQNHVTRKDCSMLSVIEGRSYRMKCETLGNAQISPTQFFYVDKIPIFSGLYQILNVHHTISSNIMSTTFEGMKMRNMGVGSGVPPITTDDLNGSISSIIKNGVGENDTFSSIESIHGASDSISQEFINQTKDLRIFNTSDIDKFFQSYNSSGFVDWYSKILSNSGLFNNIKSINSSNFKTFWDNSIPVVFEKNPDKAINIIEFLALNTIIINETGGLFSPGISEKMNPVTNSSNPGISYAFNKIEPNVKRSYNSSSVNNNKAAYDLFNDNTYKDAHGDLLFYNLLKDTSDNRWYSQIFPKDIFAKDLSSAVSSDKPTFLTEADFFKFRGRGLIQSTGRGAYKDIIDFILNYNGTNTTIINYKSMWSKSPYNKNTDIIATRSRNAQWDDLFTNTNSIIASKAIDIHSKNSGKPLYQYITNLNDSTDVILRNMLRVAQKISGTGNGSPYVELYKNRILLQTTKLQVIPDSRTKLNSTTSARG